MERENKGVKKKNKGKENKSKGKINASHILTKCFLLFKTGVNDS